MPFDIPGGFFSQPQKKKSFEITEEFRPEKQKDAVRNPKRFPCEVQE